MAGGVEWLVGVVVWWVEVVGWGWQGKGKLPA